MFDVNGLPGVGLWTHILIAMHFIMFQVQTTGARDTKLPPPFY